VSRACSILAYLLDMSRQSLRGSLHPGLLATISRAAQSLFVGRQCATSPQAATVQLNVKLVDMKNLTLVIPDLLLPKALAVQMGADLPVPALEKLLSHGHKESLQDVALEDFLCEKFAVPCVNGAPLAPLSAAFDGLGQGCWLRADPVHLDLQRDQLRLTGVEMSSADAILFCAGLNAHFVNQGLEFFAPHPQRWYVRLSTLPKIHTAPLSQVLGANVLGVLPTGEDALRWHQLFNEIQMLLFAHPVNQARELRGELSVNSVWLWGGGCSDGATVAQSPYHGASSDEILVEILAAAVHIPFLKSAAQWQADASGETQLLVWAGLRSALQRGDLAGWHSALQAFEAGYARPIWQALRDGKLEKLKIEVLAGANSCSISLSKAAAWAFWRHTQKFARHSVV